MNGFLRGHDSPVGLMHEKMQEKGVFCALTDSGNLLLIETNNNLLIWLGYKKPSGFSLLAQDDSGRVLFNLSHFHYNLVCRLAQLLYINYTSPPNPLTKQDV